jgi:hypothetical protein
LHDYEIEKIKDKINEIISGSGFGRVEIHIQNGKIVRTEKTESEMSKK